jgi:flavocytochrome c
MVQPKVAVIGSGLAGLSSSIEALRNGAQVLLIEKMPNCFGNSAKATSGINGIATRYQQAIGVHDSVEKFEMDTLKYGGIAELVQILSRKSNESIEWLSSFGIDLSILSQCGGHSVKRTHREPDRNGKPSPIGWDLVSTLKMELDKVPNFELKTSTTLKDIVLNQNRVTEIIVEHDARQEQVKVDAVILATGGYSNDHSMDSLLKEFANFQSSLPTTNGPWATGDGVKIGRRLGVDLIDLDKVQVHPTGFLDPSEPSSLQKFLGPEALRAHGGILVNKEGDRFCNELGPRDYVTEKIFQHGSELGGFKTAFLILNHRMAMEFSLPTLAFYRKKNLVHVFQTVEEVSNFIGCSVDNLKSTLRETGTVGLFGKTIIPNVFDSNDEFYCTLY